MKKITTFSLFFLFITNVFAQQQAMKRIDSMLVNIDKASLTTSILYERTTPWSKLHIFNDSINISTTSHFEQALHELYKASNEQKFALYDDVRKLYTPKSQKNTVDIGIINATFNQINYVESDESLSALRITNDEFEKINNIKQPFITQQVLVIAPLKEQVKGDIITYQFNDAFVFNESEKAIDNLIVNFDTPTDYPIITNGVITTPSVSINYPAKSIKTLSFIVTFADGSVHLYVV